MPIFEPVALFFQFNQVHEMKLEFHYCQCEGFRDENQLAMYKMQVKKGFFEASLAGLITGS